MHSRKYDGVEPSRQFYTDLTAFERVMESNPKAFKYGQWGAFHKRTYVGWNDPVAWYYVVDALSKAAAGKAIWAKHLTEWANKEYVKVWFYKTNVGKILSDVHQLFYDAFKDEPMAPFEKYQDGRFFWYSLDPPESVKLYGPDAGRILLMGLRRLLLSIVRIDMIRDAKADWRIYPALIERVYLDPEDMKWKERKDRLKKSVAPHQHS